MKVTLDGIKAKIKGETYLVLPDGRTTLCILDLENGFSVKGFSACVDPAEFDLNMGRKIAFDDAFRQIWVLEGYLLAEKMHLDKLDGIEFIKIRPVNTESIRKIRKARSTRK